jgi:serine/threonine-protein kinase HipA
MDPGLGYYAFQYEPSFARTGIELAPLTMPTSQADDPLAFTELPVDTYRRLPALLADALPDEFGNTLINGWLAAKGVAAADITALDRLAYMSKRGMGALEFQPARGPADGKSTAIEMADLVEAARRAVRGELQDGAARTDKLDQDHLSKAALAQLIKVGTSAGGARAKAVIAWNPATHEVRAGQFEVGPDFEHWLLKFDGMGADEELGGSRHYGRIEYAYYHMATAAGIAMSACRLLEENGRAHFMTRRFDREGNQKLHVQTLCAMAHLDYKQRASHDYNQFFQTLGQLGLPYESLEEAFRRMAFNVMAANCDDHTKNFAFLLRKGEPWALAPAYDITHAHNPRGEWTYQHQMSVNGKFTGIARADLLLVADRFGIGTAGKVLKQVASAVKDWRAFARKAEVPKEDRERIAKDHRIL